jgi:hypothetical protein
MILTTGMAVEGEPVKECPATMRAIAGEPR